MLIMAGQEGFEPPTRGFGDRRSTVRATGLHMKGSVTHHKTNRQTLDYLVSLCAV